MFNPHIAVSHGSASMTLRRGGICKKNNFDTNVRPSECSVAMKKV